MKLKILILIATSLIAGCDDFDDNEDCNAIRNANWQNYGEPLYTREYSDWNVEYITDFHADGMYRAYYWSWANSYYTDVYGYSYSNSGWSCRTESGLTEEYS